MDADTLARLTISTPSCYRDLARAAGIVAAYDDCELCDQAMCAEQCHYTGEAHPFGPLKPLQPDDKEANDEEA